MNKIKDIMVWLDKDTLLEWYGTLSKEEFANKVKQETGFSNPYKLLKAYNIKRISKSDYLVLKLAKEISKETLLELYFHKSMKEIGELYNVDQRIIWKLFDYYNIPKRSKSEISKNTFENHPEVINKIVVSSRKTKLDKYGDENYNNPEKTKITMLQRYNNEVGANSIQGHEKAKNTWYDKYGEIVDNPFQLSEIIEKCNSTKREKYGNNLELVVEKYQQTMLSKYGEYCTAHLGICHVPKYKDGDELFDSFPELAIWKYCKDNNLNISRNTNYFEYEYNNKIHKYFPDFIINGTFIEIKGDQFFKDDGTMCNPYDHSMDGLYEAKHQCAINNGVKIILTSECDKFISYFNSKYVRKEFILNERRYN